MSPGSQICWHLYFYYYIFYRCPAERQWMTRWNCYFNFKIFERRKTMKARNPCKIRTYEGYWTTKAWFMSIIKMTTDYKCMTMRTVEAVIFRRFISCVWIGRPIIMDEAMIGDQDYDNERGVYSIFPLTYFCETSVFILLRYLSSTSLN